MKNILLFITAFISVAAIGQNKIVKLDFENRSFRNATELPYGQAFIIEGSIEQQVSFVEIDFFYENSKKLLSQYKWDRSSKNTSETFDLTVSGGLQPNAKYDVNVTTYINMTNAEKSLLEKDLAERIVYYLRSNLSVSEKSVTIDNPRKVANGLNELIINALNYQRSVNGIEFEGLSDLVEEEIKKLSDINLKKVLKRKKDSEKEQVSGDLVNKKLSYLSGMVISEIKPFLNSNLVQQYKSFKINSVRTEKEKFTLPINAGLYFWSAPSDISNLTVKNAGITPGIGFTLPFSRGIQIKDRSLNSFGLSIGVLTSQVQNSLGEKMATPGINLPMYAALGFKTLRFVRVNAGTLVVSQVGLNTIKSLEFYPTIGLSFELNLWLGAK